MKDIKSTYQNLLDSLRNNPNEIQNFNCVIENETDRPIDKNELQRFKLSIAIYNDFRNEDERIIDYLIKEQIIAMKKANLFISETYHLLGYLYTMNRNPEKVKIFYELNTLNYDTFCGFDREHLFVNGIKETYDL